MNAVAAGVQNKRAIQHGDGIPPAHRIVHCRNAKCAGEAVDARLRHRYGGAVYRGATVAVAPPSATGTALIVDDERRLAEALRQIMLEQHHTADVMYDGGDGLAYALSGQYDVIVLDVMLPVRGGFEVVRELRAKKVATPVLQLSTRTLARGAKAVTLSFKKFEVLRLLMADPRVIVPKEDLITKIWGVDSNAEDNNVEAYISFVRKKILFLGSSAGIGTVRKVGYRLEAGGA